MTLRVGAFPDPATSTITYVLYDAAGSPCATIDAVLDYEPQSGRTSTRSADHVIRFVNEQDLRVQWLLERFSRRRCLYTALYESIGKLLNLPPQTRLFACHDYPPHGRETRWETTVAEQRAANIHVRDGITVSEFVSMRTARDATLGPPALIIPSIQLNIRAGAFPAAESNGVSYLKLPLNTF